MAQTHIVRMQHIPDCPFMYWPDGKPCESVNMYFLDIAASSTGGSLKTYAAELSHIARYCGERHLSIVDLSDENIFEFSVLLQDEVSRKHTRTRARNNNTVRTLLKRTLHFLLWYQEKLMPVRCTPLIGEEFVSPQIVISYRKNKQLKSMWSGSSVHHRSMPCSESREPKHPLCLSIIEDIEHCIDVLCSRGQSSCTGVPITAKRLSSQEYIRSRRHFMVWLMKRTGLRAAEMVGMKVNKHNDIIHTLRLYIPTRKRRREVIPERVFPVTLRDALVFHRYLNSRQAFIESRSLEGHLYRQPEALFLGTDGQSIQKTSLERDFSRLAGVAGYSDTQVCLSMFRHRFITIEVVVHLREFMSSSGKSERMMTSGDYESILKRVSAKTGHGSVQSLWHYIDLAWREMDVWGNVDNTLARIRSAESLYSDIRELSHEIASWGESKQDCQQLLNEIIGRLNELIEDSEQKPHACPMIFRKK